MPVPWFHVRLRAAQRALDDGRLDEAYQAANAPDLRDDRRARAILDDLVRPLLARARLHAQAGRWADALADLDRLAAVGRGQPDREALRAELLRRRGDDIARAAAEDGRARAAAAQIAAGRLESGRLAVDRVTAESQRAALRDALDIRQQRRDECMAAAAAALDRGDLMDALRTWRDGRERHGTGPTVDALATRLLTAVGSELTTCFAAGRVTQFRALLAEAAPLRAVQPAGLEERVRLGELLDTAAAQLAAVRHDELRRTWLRLRSLTDPAGWVDEVWEQLEAARTAHERLLASPLGRLVPDSLAPPTPGGAPAAEAAALAAALRLDGTPLLLLVDGAGSALLLSQDTVRLGRAGATPAPHVPLPADVQSHHADVVVRGEDYVLMPHGPVLVNRRAAAGGVLRSGDRLALGAHARLVFQRPSALSETAVLQLGHRHRLPQDVSVVVLLRDTCVIGPQAACHVRTREGRDRAVLFRRDDRLLARALASTGGPDGPVQPVRLGETLTLGEVRFTVTPYAHAAAAP
jgi:hypothetical protein